MTLFFDTSALVKYFHQEPGTERVTTLIHNYRSSVWLLELARVEFVSALFKRHRARSLDDDQLELALAGFDAEYATFNVEPLGRPVTTKAEALVKKHGKTQGLRTLDALHLAAFTLIAEEDWYFVAADNTLCEVIKLEGYEVVNPLTDEVPG